MLNKKYLEVPTLESKRLIIRQLIYTDKDEIIKHMKNKKVRKYFLDWPEDVEEIIKFIKNICKNNETDMAAEWVIILKSTGKIIGRIWFGSIMNWCNAVNVGYSIDDKYWNNGYATEALKTVINFGFKKMKLNRIEAWHDTNNKASARVMEKSGMIFEGTLRNRGSLGNAEMYSIIGQDYN